jgi:hypothetical protein
MNLQHASRTFVALCTIVLTTGCTTEERMTTTGATATKPGTSPLDTASVMRYSGSLRSIFASRLLSANVSAGLAHLESEGYSYVDTNSLILVRRRVVRRFRPEAFSAFLLDTPDAFKKESFVEIDTILWLAFENPAHDMANHTAILSGRGVTRLVELDVSTTTPGVIREGKIVSGQFIPGDVGTAGWLSCVGSGLLATSVTCLMSNCGWASLPRGPIP